MIPPDAIKIRGVREIQAALRQLDGESQKLLRLAFNEAATPIVRTTERNMPTGPSVRGHAKNSVKASSGQREGRIRHGGAKYPYAPWLDFGGAVGRKKSVRRKFIRSGRYLYPAFWKHRDEVQEAAENALAEILNSVDWTARGI